MLLFAFLLSGCVPTTPDEPFSPPVDDTGNSGEDEQDEQTGDDVIEALRCDLNGIDFYKTEHFLFHTNAKGNQIVYSPVGEYVKATPESNWVLRFYVERDDSAYTNTNEWIEARKFPNSDTIVCEESRLPTESFIDFYEKHEVFFKDYDEETQSTQASSAG